MRTRTLSSTLFCLIIIILVISFRKIRQKDEGIIVKSEELKSKRHLDICSSKGIQCQEESDCSVTDNLNSCLLDVTTANPVMYEEFWGALKQDDDSVKIPYDWRIGHYIIEENSATVKDDMHYPSIELEKSIRKLHKVLKNADVDNHELVVGMGSTQLMHAALFALNKKIRLKGEFSNTTVKVTSRCPYYDEHRDSTEYVPGLEWVTYDDEKDCTIEIITMPGNPDATLMDNLHSPCRFQVYDHAYYWPQYTPITNAVSGDIMLFTLTKLTGHSGTRVGWAFVKDKNIAQYTREFINFIGKGVSHESQIRASTILNMVSSSNSTNVEGDTMVLWAKKQMELRWKRIESVFENTNRFDIKVRLGPFQDIFSQDERIATPAYLWMKCNWDRDLLIGNGSCQKFILDSVGLKGREGSIYGVSNNYVRFSFLNRQSEFEILVLKLTKLVPLEWTVPVSLFNFLGPLYESGHEERVTKTTSKSQQYPPRYVIGMLQFPESEPSPTHLFTYDLGNSFQTILTVEGCVAIRPDLNESHCPTNISVSSANYIKESFCWGSHPTQFISGSNFDYTSMNTTNCPEGNVSSLYNKTVCMQCFDSGDHSRYTISGSLKPFFLFKAEVKHLNDTILNAPPIQNFNFGALVFVLPEIDRVWSNVGIGANSQFLQQLPATSIMMDFNYYGDKGSNILVFNPRSEIYHDWKKAPYNITNENNKRIHIVNQISIGKNNTISTEEGVEFHIDTGNSGISIHDSNLMERLADTTGGVWLNSSLFTSYTKYNAPDMRIMMSPEVDILLPSHVWVLDKNEIIDSLRDQIFSKHVRKDEPYLNVIQYEDEIGNLNPTIFKSYSKNVLGLPVLCAASFVFDDITRNLYVQRRNESSPLDLE